MKTDATRRKIALFGNFGAGNIGNDCTLEAMLHNLRRYVPNAEVMCICTNPEYIASNYKIFGFPIREMPWKGPPRRNSGATRWLRGIFVGIPSELRRWMKAISTLKSTDMLIMTGTGMLGDFGISALGLHYDILRWSILAKLCRCKVLFVSVGAGPIQSALSRRFVKAALSIADYRSYRDSFSKEYMDSIGFDTSKDIVYPDLVFSAPAARIPGGHNRNGQKAVIGVGLMTYYSKRADPLNDEAIYREYITKVAAFVIQLLERNYTVRLLIGDTAYDGRAQQDLREILEGKGLNFEDGRIIEEPSSSFDELLSQLAASDVVVASRFHNVLLALMVTKLVVALSYHEKDDALMAGAGMAEFCQDIEHIDVDKLIAQVATLERNATNLKPQLEQKTETFRRDLDEQYDRIFNTV